MTSSASQTPSSSLSLSTTRPSTQVSQTAIDVGAERVVGVGCWCAVVVTGCRVGTTADLVGIADAIVIAVVVYDQAIHAGLADSIDVGTERVVGVGVGVLS